MVTVAGQEEREPLRPANRERKVLVTLRFPGPLSEVLIETVFRSGSLGGGPGNETGGETVSPAGPERIVYVKKVFAGRSMSETLICAV